MMIILWLPKGAHPKTMKYSHKTNKDDTATENDTEMTSSVKVLTYYIQKVQRLILVEILVL